MKYIRHINEGFHNWHEDPEPSEPDNRRTDRKESERTLKCVGLTQYLALLAKKSNPKELYLVQMEDGDIETWIDEEYSWKYDRDVPWEDEVTPDCIVDLVDDALAGKLKPFEFRTKFGRLMTINTPEIGEGIEAYTRYEIPGVEEYVDKDPKNYAPIVKVDLPLAKFLEKEFEYRAYEHHERINPKEFSWSARQKLGKKPNKEYLKMLGALIRAFPEIE